MLGVEPGSDPTDIRRAYLALARRYHPDFYSNATPSERAVAERRMQEVNQAFAALSGDGGHRVPAVPAEPAPFRPFDPDDDDPDPLDMPDVPYRPPPAPTGRRRAATLAPVVLFVAAIGLGAAGLVLASLPLLALAVLVTVAAAVGFLVLPLVAMASASRDEG